MTAPHKCISCNGEGGTGDLGHAEPDGGWSGFEEKCGGCRGEGSYFCDEPEECPLCNSMEDAIEAAEAICADR